MEELNVAQQAAIMGIEILGVILAALAAVVVRKLIKQIDTRTGIDIDEATERRINEVVSKGITYAEAMANKRAKLKLKKFTMPEKMESAAGFALSLAEAKKLPEWATGKIEALIESKLGEKS